MTVSLLLSLASPAFAVAPSALGDITVTEFQADPSKVPPYWGEWFELYNNAGTTLDFNGVTVTLADGHSFTIAGAPLVGVDDYLMLGVNDDVSKNGNVNPDVLYDFTKFNISGPDDSITVSYGSTTLDILDWDSTWGIVSDEAESCAPNASGLEWANDLKINWCSSTTFIAVSGMKGSPGVENEFCNNSPPGVDNDGDGYTEAEGDCDDTDVLVNPGAIDGDADPFGLADDDADCDGVRDDGLTDDDGDGWTEILGDCDDEDVNTYPGAVESDDGEDDDCDGCVDDVDDDLDGWTECPEEDGRYDCQDSAGNQDVNPDATELPYDGIDQDCDGLDDDCDLDGDHYEATSEYGAGCDGHDCDDNNTAIHPGAPEVSDNGLDDDCDGTIDIPDRDLDGYTGLDGDCMDLNEEMGASSALIALSRSVHPDAPELCGDLVDNDCNGFIDDLPECANPAASGHVRGGGICGVMDGAAPVGAGAMLGLALMVATRRRRGGEA